MQNPDSPSHKTSPRKRNKKHTKSDSPKKNIDKHRLFKQPQKNTLSDLDDSKDASFIAKDKLSLLQLKYSEESMTNSEYLELLSDNARMLPADNNEFAEWITAIEERKSYLKRS